MSTIENDDSNYIIYLPKEKIDPETDLLAKKWLRVRHLIILELCLIVI